MYIFRNLLPQFTELSTNMKKIYSTAKICDFKNNSVCDLALTPHLTNIMAKSRNYDELTHVWKAWRDSSGKKMRKLFQDSVALMSEAAKLNGNNRIAK